MWLDSSLEEEEACGTSCVEGNLLTLAVGNLRHFVDERNDVAEELHETANAHILYCVNAEDGEHATAGETFANAFAHLVFGEVFAFEELLHEGFVVFGSSFDECLVHFHCLVHLVGRNVFNLWLATIGAP